MTSDVTDAGPMRALAALVRDRDRIAIRVGTELREVPAMDIFRAAIRGAREVGGLTIEDVRTTTPKIKFMVAPPPSCLWVFSEHDRPYCAAAVRHENAWHALPIESTRDHVLLGDTWYPLSDTYGQIVTWIRESTGAAGGTRASIDAATYLAMYRWRNDDLEIVDELTDEQVQELAGPVGPLPALNGTLYDYQEVGFRWLSARAFKPQRSRP